MPNYAERYDPMLCAYFAHDSFMLPFYVFSRTAAQEVMREQALQCNRLGSCLPTKPENGRLLPPFS